MNNNKDNCSGNHVPQVFIDEAECLRRVPVSRRTWFSWREAGKIPTVKLGRRCLYHWPSVEAALLRMQRGGLMVFLFIFAALATPAMGHTSILGVHSSQAQVAHSAACNLSAGNTTTGQSMGKNIFAGGNNADTYSAQFQLSAGNGSAGITTKHIRI